MRRLKIKILMTFLFILLFSLPFFPKENIIVIKNGNILRPDGKFIKSETILIQGNKINSIGKGLNIPDNAVIIDARNKWILPGLIDVYKHPVKISKEKPEKSDYISPEQKISEIMDPTKKTSSSRETWDLFNLYKKTFKEALEKGITTIVALPDNAKIIGGVGAVLKLKDIFLEKMIISDSIALKIGFERKEVDGLRTHMGVMWAIRENIFKTKDKLGKKSDETLTDLKTGTLLNVLNNSLPLIAEANTEEEIARTVSLGDEFDLKRIILFGSIDSTKAIPDIGKRNFQAYLTLPEIQDVESFSKILALLFKENTLTALYSDKNLPNSLKILSSLLPWLKEEMIPDEKILMAITINPAKIMGLSRRIGSLEPGKDADIIILDKYPLNPLASVEIALIDGDIIYERKK